MRPALLLITAFFVNISITQLQAQETSFVPGEITSAIDSVATATPSVLNQQAIGTGLDNGNALFDVAATGETISLPDTTTYSEPSFAGSNDVQFSQVSTARRSGSWLQRSNEYLRQASINASTEGITISFLGGRAHANWVDEFGRSIGESVRVGDTIGVSIGKRFSPTFRTDFELSWRSSDMSGLLPSYRVGEPPIYFESELRHFSGLVNFYYDFDRAPGRLLTPYIGIGLGVAQQELQLDLDAPPNQPSSFEESQTLFALQSMIGVSARITVRNELFVEARGFSTFEADRSNVFNEAIFGWRHTF